MNSKINSMDTKPVALACELSGGYLIEASAGTGKTWTLTGIILRLLVERQTPPERIIATTFTKKAAAELQQRIQARLIEFSEACHWLKERQITLAAADEKERLAQIKAHSADRPELQDPINEHLLLWLLNEPPQQLDITRHALTVLLSNLNKLYIGTLDSFAHKLLKEYRGIVGNISDKTIVADTQIHQQIMTLLNDRVRYLQAEFSTTPELFALVDMAKMADIASWYTKINNALLFFTAEIDSPIAQDTTLYDELKPQIDALNELFEKIKQSDYSDIADTYGDSDYRVAQGMSKSKTLYKKFPLLIELVDALKDDALKNNGVRAFRLLDKSLLDLASTLTEEKIRAGFNKKGNYTALIAKSAGRLEAIGEAYALFVAMQVHINTWLMSDLARYVRQHLQTALDEQAGTTHTLKMVHLLNALKGGKGKVLARHIFHAYPVALIDEVQDINGEQAELIKRIYLTPTHQEHDKRFLLLVGDPKQAIYRFRGGDVANYNALKQLGLHSDYTLNVNRRSNAALITILNHWFGKEGDADYGELGQGIRYEQISAHKQEVSLHWQEPPTQIFGQSCLSLLHLAQPSTRFATLAQHINALLQSGATLTENGVARAVMPSDIALLVTNNDHIPILAEALKRYGIASTSTQDSNVFAGRASSDLYRLLQAILDDSDAHKIDVLTGLLFLSLADSEQYLVQVEVNAALTHYLHRARLLWQSKGLLHALDYAFGAEPVIPTAQAYGTLWEYWATFKGATRYLADMWQLYELLATWQMPPELLLKHFIAQMHTASERHQRVALPSTSAVTITSVHKSKGLEFNIVYILGLNKKADTNKDILFPYTTDDNSRRLSPKAEDGDTNYQLLDQQETMAENKRLGYVALTRAAEKVYVVTQDYGTAQNGVLKMWGILKDGKKVVVPPRLENLIDMVVLDDEALNNMPTLPYQSDDSILSLATTDNWESVLPNTAFVGQGRTSFTALSRRWLPFSAHEQTLSASDYDADEPFSETIIVPNDIRERFMRGTVAGTFLHKVLEKIDGDNVPTIIQQVAKTMGLVFDEETTTALADWLNTVGSTPFTASGIALYDLRAKSVEFAFMLGLGAKFAPAELSELLYQFADKRVPKILDERALAYLNGEIDLLYQHGDKYYIVDYKSNVLDDYTTASMTKAMDEHGYWLQAAIYQVALHRLLRLKIADYRGNEAHYLGAVEYVFLRGVGINAANDTGRLLWEVPLPLVLALDALFG